jgi:hypothetical protein
MDAMSATATALSQPEPKLAAASSSDRAAIVARLRQLARVVTLGPEAVARECDMRIPAEPLRDADFVLSTAADLLSQHEPEGVRDDAELRTVFAIGAEARWREGFPESWSLTDMERAAHTAGLRAVLARKDRPQ